MFTVSTVLGTLSGGAVFVTSIVVMVRGIYSQVNATKDNTRALEAMKTSLDRLDGKFDNHETRISRLEGRDAITQQSQQERQDTRLSHLEHKND